MIGGDYRWPGGLGKTATHAVVHARLLLPSNKEGAKISHKDMGVRVAAAKAA